MEPDLGRFLQLLYTFEHQKALALFDRLVQDESNFWRIADALLLVCANHQDAKLTVPHGLQTLEAAREMFAVAGPHASLGLPRGNGGRRARATRSPCSGTRSSIGSRTARRSSSVALPCGTGSTRPRTRSSGRASRTWGASRTISRSRSRTRRRGARSGCR